MAFPEGLTADGAHECFFSQLLRMQVRPRMLLSVVGPHVKNQVRGQAKGEVALCAPVPGGQAQGCERGW